MPSGSERQKEKLCWNGRDSVPDLGGDDSDHEEKSEQGLSVKSLDNHQDLPSIVKEQMDELKTMTEQIKLAQRGKAFLSKHSRLAAFSQSCGSQVINCLTFVMRH